MRVLLSISLLLVVTACATGKRPPLEALARAAGEVEEGSSDGRALALAAWDAWLVRGDASRMEELGQRAVRSDPGQPWGWLALAESARRGLDRDREVEALGKLIEGAPSHPLAAVAARRLAASTRRSIELDERLEALAQRLLAASAEGARGAGGRLDPEAADALRSVLRHVHAGRGRGGAAEGGEPLDLPLPAVREAGAMTAASLVGPFSRWQNLDRERSFPPELPQPIPARYRDFDDGPLPLRPFSIPDGWLSLAPENRGGNVYYALAVAEVPSGGSYTVRLTTTSSTGASVFIDGVEVVGRQRLGAPTPRIASAQVELGAGSHLVALRIVRGAGSDGVSLRIAPSDGAPSRIAWRAAAPGDAPGSPPPEGRIRRHPPRARQLVSALEPEVGILAVYVAAADAQSSDLQGAKGILASGLELLPQSPPLLILRSALSRADRDLPDAVGQARAAADLEAALQVDPENPRALLGAASLLQAAGRHQDAMEKLDVAAELVPASSAVALARARVARSRGFDAMALELAKGAAARGGGDCAAAGLLFDLARRVEAAKLMEEVARDHKDCPGGRSRLATLLGDRGDLGVALSIATRLMEETPQSPASRTRLADLYLASGEPAAGAEEIAALEAAWPRNAYWPKRRAELLERAGDEEGALAAKRRALSLDGSDLRLRRTLALGKGEPDILAAYDRDGLEVIRRFEERPRSFDTPSVIIYDFGAVEVYADGSMSQRIHLVSKVLDKAGIDALGEVNVPGGAEVIRLRTIKADGRILEPEEIGGKDSISLPNLEVGDYVEIEYLESFPSRGPALPGWSAAPFYFRAENEPIHESVYVVRADRRAGLELDLHNDAPEPELVEDDAFITMVLRARRSPPLIPEPDSVPLGEILPWVQAGSGAGEEEFAAFLADGLAARSEGSFEVSAWAREIAAGVRSKDPTEVVRAVYERAMEEIEGGDPHFGASPATTLARRRGNRLPLIKAALEELGIESRFAVLRPFSESPLPRRFPQDGRFRHLVLVVRPDPAGGLIWLDPSVRWAPFGEVAPVVRGLPGYILPDRDADGVVAVSSPYGADAPQGREVELALRLAPNCELSGEGIERYLGFDGAWMRSGIERLDEGRRHQVIEGALARSFRGLVLEDFEIDADGPSGSPLELRYRFRVPDYAHPLGDGLAAVELDFFAAQLGRRFLAQGERETPLLLARPEQLRSRITIELPPGAEVVGGPEAARELGAFGSYTRRVALTPGQITVQEELVLDRGRVWPQEYGEFAGWVMAVDRAQAAELILSVVDVEAEVEEEPEPAPESGAEPEPELEQGLDLGP